MTEQREARFWRYEEDFGASRLTEEFQSAHQLGEESALRLVSTLARSDDDDALALREDAQLLLDSPLRNEDVRAVWLAATGGSHDPGPRVRDWLRRIMVLCEEEISRNASPAESFYDGTPPLIVVDEAAMKEAVISEVRAFSENSVPADVVSALERVAIEVDADLGFRLFLRVVKACSVRVTVEQSDRYQKIGEGFGYPGRLVYDALDVLWPRFDDASVRRRFERDFGFSLLTGRFYGDLWQHSHTVDEGIRGAAADYAGIVPGSSAFVLLEDLERLLRSPLSDGTLTTLWLAATGRGYDIGELGIEARNWLRQIAETCTGRLREIDPGFETSSTGPASMERADSVLQELWEIAPVLTDAIHDSPWFGVTTSPWFALSDVTVPALEQVVAQVDPDLGFRLLLRILRAYSVPVTEERYTRYEELGERLGYGRHHVVDLVELVHRPR